jgi:hypothetical protein
MTASVVGTKGYATTALFVRRGYIPTSERPTKQKLAVQAMRLVALEYLVLNDSDRLVQVACALNDGRRVERLNYYLKILRGKLKGGKRKVDAVLTKFKKLRLYTGKRSPARLCRVVGQRSVNKKITRDD